MDELLAAAAAALNAPPAMVERSAAARAKAQGVSIEDVLTAWAGGAAVTASAPTPAPAVSAAPSETTTPDTPPAAAPAAVATDDASLIAAAAVRMSMPESMIKRSAAARAKAAGLDPHAVLLEWAGIDPATAAAAAATPPAAPSTPPAAVAPEPPAPAAPAALPAMDDGAILAAAAQKMGMSETMVKRSAAARAKATGVDAAAVLAEWAGVAAASPGATSTPAEAPVAPEPAAAAPVAAAPAAPREAEVEVLGDAAPAPVTAKGEPDPLEPEEQAVAAGALPRWLAALFVVIPAFAIGYALFLPNGPNCGDAGSLAVDPVTGLAVNCDGTEYGSEQIDLFSLGAQIYDGLGCAACHGPDGAGVANFPGFSGGSLLATFPQDWCPAQVEWITLGTQGWPDPTYGASNKPVGGSGAVMPGFAGTLSFEEITAVALYERVQFGGQDLAAAQADCTAPPTGVALGG